MRYGIEFHSKKKTKNDTARINEDFPRQPLNVPIKLSNGFTLH